MVDRIYKVVVDYTRLQRVEATFIVRAGDEGTAHMLALNGICDPDDSRVLHYSIEPEAGGEVQEWPDVISTEVVFEYPGARHDP